MTTEAASATDLQPLLGRELHDLLVLTDAERCGRSALALPFWTATVNEVATAQAVSPEGHYDAVVIDRSSYDPIWLDSIAKVVVAALRPEGRVIVTLPPPPDAAPAEAAALPGLVWHGLGVLNGRVCAVLRAGESTGTLPAGSLLTTALAAVRLAGPAGRDGHQWPTTAQCIDARHRSERALLLQIDRLGRELDLQQRLHQGSTLVRTILRRSRLGRVLLRILRPIWRLSRRAWRSMKRRG